MDNAIPAGIWRRGSSGELSIPRNTPLPAAICRFRARKIDVVTKVACRKSLIRVAEERAWKHASNGRGWNDGGGGGHLINN